MDWKFPHKPVFIPYYTIYNYTVYLQYFLNYALFQYHEFQCNRCCSGPITLNMGIDPLYMGMTTAISSAFGYFSAVAAPACMIIYSSGMVKITDFFKAGWRICIMSALTLLIIYQFYWPLVIGLTNFK